MVRTGEEEWEILLTAEVESFLDNLYESDPASHQLVNQAILILERNGPAIRILLVFECATRRCQYRMGVGDPRRRVVVAA
ncbi:MAG: hypothetical protein ACM3ML_06415 [Micromonosporaceae bacterium]